MEHKFPFLVVGFYEKTKRKLIGKDFVFTDKILKVSSGGGTDINTGKPLKIKTGDKWRCKDLTIEDKYYTLSLVIENSAGEMTVVSYNGAFGSVANAYTYRDAIGMKAKFGSKNFHLILQGKVSIGMTQEMCSLSWGEPNDINITVLANNRHEQWVYDDNYLYFNNGLLTAIQ